MPRIASFETREWINPHNDRRPMVEGWFLVTLNDRWHKYVSMAKYDDGWMFVDEDEEVTAWMPLPEPAVNEELLQDVETYIKENYNDKEEEAIPRQ